MGEVVSFLDAQRRQQQRREALEAQRRAAEDHDAQIRCALIGERITALAMAHGWEDPTVTTLIAEGRALAALLPPLSPDDQIEVVYA
jgi:hypothetical protein